MTQAYRETSEEDAALYEDPIDALSNLPQYVTQGVLDELTGEKYRIEEWTEKLEEENLLESNTERKNGQEIIKYSTIEDKSTSEKWQEAAYQTLNEF